MSAYYNERDAFAAAWLRLLMKAGVIADGEVDERDIRQIEPADLRGFAQCHFFAGIGVWSYSLRYAGWPDDKPVWTGSCPCQPFSVSGKRGGASDERHLWPAWFPLIVEAKPRAVPILGEQVASDDGLAWLDLVSADLEGAGYACGAVDTCAAGVGAPHIRQRLYFVADSQRDGRWPDLAGREAQRRTSDGRLGAAGELGDTQGNGHEGRSLRTDGESEIGIAQASGTRIVGDTNYQGPQGRRISWDRTRERFAGATGLVGGFWERADWLYCRDGKYRPVEPGTFPLAHGAANRVGRLRGYGNALCAPQAIAFIQAAREVLRG